MQKVLVEVLGANGVRKRKKYPVEGDSIIIRKAKGRRTGYSVKFDKDCRLFDYVGIWPFKRLREVYTVKQDASECVNYYNKEGVETPTMDRKSSEKLFQVNVIKSAGETANKITIPTVLWLMLGAIIFLNVLSLLIASGRIRIV